MARFYGVIKGTRGEASRLGGAESGLRATAASWSGAVEAQMYINDDGVDYVRVRLIPWHGAGTHRVLYDGPASGKQPKEQEH